MSPSATTMSGSWSRSPVTPALAIHNARMHEELRQLAVLQERERIAQDLHDGSIQSLYAVSLALEDTEELMAHPTPGLAAERIDHAIETIHGTIQEIRDFIMGLRPRRPDGRRPAGRADRADRRVRAQHAHRGRAGERPRRAARPRRDAAAHPAHAGGHEQRGPPRRSHEGDASTWRIVANCCGCLSSTTAEASTPARDSDPAITA